MLFPRQFVFAIAILLCVGPLMILKLRAFGPKEGALRGRVLKAQSADQENNVTQKRALQGQNSATTCVGTFVDNVGVRHTGSTAVQFNEAMFIFYEELVNYVKMASVNTCGQSGEARYFLARYCLVVDDQCILDNWVSATGASVELTGWRYTYSVDNVVCQLTMAQKRLWTLQSTGCPNGALPQWWDNYFRGQRESNEWVNMLGYCQYALPDASGKRDTTKLDICCGAGQVCTVTSCTEQATGSLCPPAEIPALTPAPTSQLTPTPTPAPNPASTPAPTPQPKCKSWCNGNKRGWAKKCAWEKCGGCPACLKTSGITCGNYNSNDCQAEHQNAQNNNQVKQFCNRCATEGGSNPLRKRCKHCCDDCDTSTR